MELYRSRSHRSHLERYRSSEQREIEVTWRVDVSDLPKQIKKASPKALYPSDARQDGDDWWVPLRMLMQADHSISHRPENKQVLQKIAEYFSCQVHVVCYHVRQPFRFHALWRFMLLCEFVMCDLSHSNLPR